MDSHGVSIQLPVLAPHPAARNMLGRPSVKPIIAAALRVGGIGPKDFFSRYRHRPVVTLRWAAMMVALEYLPFKPPAAIAREFGRHHTTLIHARRGVADDPQRFRATIEAIKSELAERIDG